MSVFANWLAHLLTRLFRKRPPQQTPNMPSQSRSVPIIVPMRVFSHPSMSSASSMSSAYSMSSKMEIEEKSEYIFLGMVSALPKSDITDLVFLATNQYKKRYLLDGDYECSYVFSSSEEMEQYPHFIPLLKLLSDEHLNILLTHPNVSIRRIVMRQKKEKNAQWHM